MMIGIHISLAALVAALFLVVEHYAPWFRLPGNRRLHPVANYVLGCVALFVPYSVLLIYWGLCIPGISPFSALAALWSVMGAGGLTVGGCYVYDNYTDRGRKLAEFVERELHYRAALTGKNEG